MLTGITEVVLGDCGLDKSQIIIVGVSGGPDSMCLLHVLFTLGYKAAVVHVHHGLRAEADADQKLVAREAARLGLACTVVQVDVREHARTHGQSVEQAARQLRYQALMGEAHRSSAQAVAVGHTADDQVETVLMHIIRGAGPQGLQGMSYRTMLAEFSTVIPVVRPLLGFWRREILEYCSMHGIEPARDMTNDDPSFLRNRLRNELIPNMESYNPEVRAAIWRLSRHASAENALIDSMTKEAWKQIVVQESAQLVSIKANNLLDCPRPMQSRVIRMVCQHLLQTHELTTAVSDGALNWIARRHQGQHQLSGGLLLARERDFIHIAAGAEALPDDKWPQLVEPGAVVGPLRQHRTVPLAGSWRLQLASVSTDGNAGSRFVLRLPEGALRSGLYLRAPRDGDRLRPAGMHGHRQKLSDIFVNAKIPQRFRAAWPIVTTGEEVIWVAGLRVAEGLEVDLDALGAVTLQIFRDEVRPQP